MASLDRAAMVVALALGACVPTGIGGDLERVRDVTHAPVTDLGVDVDPQTPEEARKELAKPLDADAAVRIALLDNRELRAKLREMGVSRGQLAQAALLPNPVAEVELFPERTSTVELRVEYDITGLVLAPIRAGAAEPELDAARYRAARAVIETGYRARAAFYRALAAEQKLALANRSLDALAASRDAAEALFRAGNLRELDFATQDAAYQTARAEAAERELMAGDAHEALVRVLGLHGPDTAFKLAGAMGPVPDSLPPARDLEVSALRASLGMKARKSHLEALGKRAGLARAEGWIPDVAADVHAFQGERDPVTGATLDQGWLLSGGVRVTVPLFDHKQGTAAMYDAELDAELERYLGAAVDLRSRARALDARLVTAQARAKQYQSVIVPARKRVVDQAILQYTAMQISVFQFLQTKRDELSAELAAVDAACFYWTAQAAFDALLAGCDVDADRAGPESGPVEPPGANGGE